MQLELLLSNEQRVLPSVRAFVHEALAQLPMDPADGAELAKLVVAAVEDAVEHAYRPGEEGSVKLVIQEKDGRLEIRVRDFGMPRDIESMERKLHAAGKSPVSLFGCHTAGLVDEMHWLAFGPQGKALRLCKWLHVTNITETAEAKTMKPFRDDARPAPEQEYVVRRILPTEAVAVSQLMYRTYGGTYFNRDVYYPERIAAKNASESAISFVAQAADGTIVGHEALELDQPGPVAETGQAVVDPAHRGRGLLSRLRNAAIDVARRHDLAGWYGDAVAVHTMTQKSNRDHGGRLACVDLAISPKTEVFRGIAANQPQRVTCLLYFHWLTPAALRTIYVPKTQQEIVAEIYEHLDCPIRFGEPSVPSGHGTLAVAIDPGGRKASIRPDQLGADTLHAVRCAKRDLVERSRVEVVYVDLSLADPAAPAIAEALERDGFGLAGVAPHFLARGDALRLVYLVEALAREPIKTLQGFETRLVDYALAEQTRVRAAV